MNFGETDEVATTAWTLFGHGWPFWVVMVVLAIFILIMFFSSFTVVEQQTRELIERWGKFNRVLEPGLRLKIPFGIEKVAEGVDLRLMQKDVEVKVKTKTGEFITLPVTIQYRVLAGKAYESFYEVFDVVAMITSLVLNEVKATAATMTLDEVFDSRDVIKTAVQDKLTDKMGGYGYAIIDVLIDNPSVPETIEAAFNDVTAAKQRQLAATADAEALRIRMVGEATAEGQSLTIKAESIVGFRETVAAGNALAVLRMTEGTTIPHSQALMYLTLVDTNDAVRDAAGKGATVVVATGRPQDGLYATLDGHLPAAA